MTEDKVKDAPETPTAAPAGTRRRRRRWRWIVAAVVAALLILVAMLPSILSLGFARRMALASVNKRLTGKVEMESWSLGWFSGFKLRRVKVSDAQAEPVIEVELLTIPASVFALLGSNKRLGTVEVESPKANIVVNPDGTNNLMSLIASPEQRPPKEPGAPAAGPTPLGFDVQGKLVVRDGEITIRPVGEPKPFLVSGLNADVTIESLEKPIRLNLAAVLGEEKASLEVEGSAKVLENGVIKPEAVEANVKVALAGLDLAPISGLARQYGAPVAASGTLDVNVDVAVKGMSEVQAKGEVALKSLALSGEELLGGDRPTFDRVSLTFDIGAAGSDIRISSFDLSSPVATASASGSITLQTPGGKPTGELAAKAELRLAELAARLPQTLHLQKGLTIESGTVALDSRLTSGDQGLTADLSLRVDDLAGRQEGERFTLDEPISLTLRASADPEGRPGLESLEIKSSFMTAEGHGDLEDFEMTLTSDLDAAMRELAKFVDLGEKTLSGAAELALRVTGADPQQKKVVASLELDRLRLSGFAPKPLEIDDAGLSLEALAALGPDNAPERISDLKLNLHCPLATASLSVDKVTLNPGAPPTVEGGQLSVKGSLGDLIAFGQYLGAVPQNLDVRGQLDLACEISVVRDKIHAERIQARVEYLKVSVDGTPAIEEEKLTLAAAATIKAKSGDAELRSLEIASGLLNLSASGSLQDWSGAKKLHVEGDVKCNFDRIGPLVAAFTGQPVELSGEDPARFTVETALGGEDWRDILQATAASLDVRLARLSYMGIESGPIVIPIRAKNGRVSLEADLGLVTATGEKVDAIPSNVDVQARVNLSVAVSLAGSEVRAERLQVRVDSLKVATEGMPTVEEDQLTLEATGAMRPESGDVDIKSVKITSGLLNVAAQGSLKDLSGAKRLQAEGDLECNFDRIGPLVAAFTGQPIELSGKTPKRFQVDTALGGADWREILAATAASIDVSLAHAKYIGIETGAIDIPIRVKDRHASVKVDTTVGEGRLLLPVDVDCAAASPVLTVPKDTMILTDVPLSDDLADQLVSRVSPLFKGCTVTGGRISFLCRELSVPLDETLMQRATAEADLTLKQVRLGSSGWLQGVLDMFHIGGFGVDLPDQSIGVALREGRVYQQPMAIQVGKYGLILSGSVGLADTDLDMLLEMPITEESVGRDAYEILKDEKIEIRITGTADNPKIPRDVIQSNIKNLIKSAGRKLLEKKGRDLIEKGLGDLLKKRRK